MAPYWHLRTLKAKRETMLTYKRNVRDAYSKMGIKYTPTLGLWPPYIDHEPDMWFFAKYPNGESMKIHLTYERGYEDIDGMAHLPLYRQFASHILPDSAFIPGRADGSSIAPAAAVMARITYKTSSGARSWGSTSTSRRSDMRRSDMLPTIPP